MPSQHEKHRPVIGGIMIGVAFTRAGNMLLQIDKGTLTGLRPASQIGRRCW